MISLIVAASINNVIGVRGELPWRLSSDLQRFKALTMGKPIVMGRLTHESIGKALPGRQNIVITRRADYAAEGCDVVHSPQAALAVAGDAAEIMVIGGGHIYEVFLPLADRIYLTRVRAVIEGDAFLPELDERTWQPVDREEHEANDVNDHDYCFITLERARGRTPAAPTDGG